MENEVFDNLDIKPEDFRKLGYCVIDMMTEYFASIQETRVFPAVNSSEIAKVFEEDFPEKGQDPLAVVNEWKSKILPYATHLGSPRYFGFVNGSGTMIGTLAEALAATVNMNPGGWKPAPSATEVERRTIAWIAEMIGYPADCGGLFTSGGTMASFTAIQTALRNRAPYDTTAKGLQDKDIAGKFRVYMSDHEGHISIIRVADLLNLGRESVHLVKSREDFSMDTGDLERAIDEDIANGDFPLCVVAQVGSINVGVIDPLEEISAICRKRNIWFHADGACGAVGAILPEKRSQYKGLELADSVTLDPHKWLYIPYDCGCVLVRDPEKMRRAFSLQAPYLRGTLPSEYTGLYYLDYGPEMSRGFRALKVWMSLKHIGAEGYRKLLSQNVKCVEYLDSLVRNDKDFEALHKPNLLMYCMRYSPLKIKDKYGNNVHELEKYLDKLNQQIADEIQISGTAFIMTSKVLGKVVIRFSVCSHRTTQEDIELVFLKLKEIGESFIYRGENL
jgi:aromatic-L-amino-acid/L-tryptophan decarboxylase